MTIFSNSNVYSCGKIILISTLSFLITGCTSMPPLPSSPFQLDQVDTSPLQGKVILIDPGHGGKYRGSIGKMGLKESEVNLGVALYLWGFLHSAGAKPIMTRTADTTQPQGSAPAQRPDRLASPRGHQPTPDNSSTATAPVPTPTHG